MHFNSLFNTQLALDCNALAVIDAHAQTNYQQLSYKQLDALSNAIALSLVSSGLKKGSVIAVRMPRSIEVWPIILGIFRAGYTYLPIDDEWPLDRVATVLSMAGSQAIICASKANFPDLNHH